MFLLVGWKSEIIDSTESTKLLTEKQVVKLFKVNIRIEAEMAVGWRQQLWGTKWTQNNDGLVSLN